MHNLTAHISEMLTDRANATIAIQNKVLNALSIGIFKFDLDSF